MAEKKQEQYGITVLPVNAEQLSRDDITAILKAVVLEFPIDTIEFQMPKWVETLEYGHWVKENVIAAGKEILGQVSVMKDLYEMNFPNKEAIAAIRIDQIDLSNGRVILSMSFDDKY